MLEKKKLGTMIQALLVAYGITAVLLCLLAVGLWKLDFSENMIHGGLILLYLVSVFSGGFYIGKKHRKRKFIWGMGVGFIYAALWISAAMISNGPFLIMNQNTLTIAAICILGGTLGGMIA